MLKTSTIAGIAVGTVVAAGLAVGAYMLMSKKSSEAGKGPKKRGKRVAGEQLPAEAQADIEGITMDVVVKAVGDSMAVSANSSSEQALPPVPTIEDGDTDGGGAGGVVAGSAGGGPTLTSASLSNSEDSNGAEDGDGSRSEGKSGSGHNNEKQGREVEGDVWCRERLAVETQVRAAVDCGTFIHCRRVFV